MTVSGATVGENYKDARSLDTKVIRTYDNPLKDTRVCSWFLEPVQLRSGENIRHQRRRFAYVIFRSWARRIALWRGRSCLTDRQTIAGDRRPRRWISMSTPFCGSRSGPGGLSGLRRGSEYDTAGQAYPSGHSHVALHGRWPAKLISPTALPS